MANYDATSGSYTTRLTVTETGTDTATNTSTVQFSLTLIKNSGTGLWNNDSCSWSININGTSYSGTFTYDFRSYSSLTLKGSTNQTVTHDGDGSKKIAVSASVNMDNTPYVYTMSPSGELTLTTIPRASDVSVSNYSITNTTGSLSATITSKANFYHKWRWRMNSGSWSSWTNKGLISTTSSTVTVANTTLLAQLPTATSGSFNIEVATYSDSGYSNHVGTKSATCTVSVNTSNIKPSVSLGNIGLNSSPISGYAVAGYSKVQSAWTTTNSSGATSVTTYFTVSTGSLATTSSSSTSGTVVSNVIPSNSSNYTLTIYAYAKDSRGAVGATVSKAITVYGYQPPTANLTAYRTSSSSSTSEDGAGTYAYVTFSGAVRSSVNSQNTVQSTVCTYSGSISGTATNGGHYALADTQTVTFTLTVTDKVTSSVAQKTISTASYPLDLYDDGSGNVGAGVGAVARANEFNLGVSLASNLGNYKEIMVDLTQTEMMAYDSSLTTSSADSAWFTVLLKMICVKYPNAYQTVFKGKVKPNSLRFYNVMIYSTSSVSNGLPQYSYGYYCAYGNSPIRSFGTNEYTFYLYNGVYYADNAGTASTATNATNATNVGITNTNPTSGTWYYPTWVTATSGNLPERVNNGYQYYALEGTASAVGASIIQLGNGTASGTAGNKNGRIRLYSSSSSYVDLYMTATTTARTLYFPSYAGTRTLAVHDTSLYTGTLTGGNTASIDMSSYNRVRVFALTWGVQHVFEIDLSDAGKALSGHGLTDSSYPFQGGSTVVHRDGSGTSGGNIMYYSVSCKVSSNKKTLWITSIGYSSLGTSFNAFTSRLNNSGYYVYRVEGIL